MWQRGSQPNPSGSRASEPELPNLATDHFPESEEIQKGHMRNQRKVVKSTKNFSPQQTQLISEAKLHPEEKQHNCFLKSIQAQGNDLHVPDREVTSQIYPWE